MLGMQISLPVKFYDLPGQAKQLGCDTFQVFIRNNRNCSMRSFTELDVNLFNTNLLQNGIYSYVIHANYANNFCIHPDNSQLKRYVAILEEDLHLLTMLAGTQYYVIHPGSNKNLTPEQGLFNMCNVMKYLAKKFPSVIICPEYMSGAGTQVISTPEQLQYCLDAFKDIPNIRICVDTCHVFASGYEPLDIIKQVEDKLGVVHLNGSTFSKGSKKDRHASFLNSLYPTESLLKVVSSVPSDVPVILETPNATMLDDFRFICKNFKD